MITKKSSSKKKECGLGPIIHPVELKPERIEEFRKADPSVMKKKELKNWISWWESHFTSEDYFKFLNLQVF
jgi:hypothetical protein